MSNSSLVSYTQWAPYCTKPRSGTIKGISIHTMAGPATVEGCGQTFQESQSSAHYGIGPDGRIGQYVDEANRAWCCSHIVDHSVVTIEVSSIQTYKEPYECTKAAYESLIALCVDICQRNKIEKLVWKEGKANCPAYTGNWTACNMVAHLYTSNSGKVCPGTYLLGKYGEIAAEVNRRLSAGNVTPTKATTTAPAVEPVELAALLKKATAEEAHALLLRAEAHGAAIPEPDWSRKEGHWAKATAAGIVDGTAPEWFVRRDELAAILGRLGLLNSAK